jgi:hypothetical protein
MLCPDLTIDYKDENAWTVVAEYVTNQGARMDFHENVDHTYRHAEKFIHESGSVLEQELVGTPCHWRWRGGIP